MSSRSSSIRNVRNVRNSTVKPVKIWSTISPRRTLSKNTVKNIISKMSMFCYNKESCKLSQETEINNFDSALKMDVIKVNYAKEHETYTKDDNVFIITDEIDFWKDKMDLLDTFEHLREKNNDPSIFALHNTTLLTDYLKSDKIQLKQSYNPETPANVKLVYYNSNYRTPTYNLTPSLVKNRLDTDSLTCIKYKDFLYENLILLEPTNHSFMPNSVIITNANRDLLTLEYLNENINGYYRDNQEPDNPINLDEIFIVRPVDYKDNVKYTGSFGADIIIIDNKNGTKEMSNQKIQDSLKLLDTYNSIIVSKYLKSKIIKLQTYTETEGVKEHNHIIHLRVRVLASVIYNQKTNKYEMFGHIIKVGTMYYNEKPVNIHNNTPNTSNTSNTESTKAIDYSDINTHNYPKLFDDNDDNELNKKYKIYYEQIIHIINSVLNVLKSRIQIYPETTHSFDDLALDLIINENDRVYLAEVNNNSGVISHRIEKAISERFKDKQKLRDLLIKDYAEYLRVYTTTLFNTIINGILEPIFTNNTPIPGDYKDFTTIQISSDLANEPSRMKHGKLIPIKTKSTKTTLTRDILNFSRKTRNSQSRISKSRNKSTRSFNNNPNNNFTTVSRRTRRQRSSLKPK